MSPRPGTSGSGASPSASASASFSGLDDQEENVRIAIWALGDMKNGTGRGGSPTTSFQPTPALSTTSRSSSPSLPSPSLGGEEDHSSHHIHHHQQHHSPYHRGRDSGHSGMKRARDQSLEPEQDVRLPTRTTATNEDFVSRVSHLPLVNSALRVYENSKASSRVVKYGAEMMESSVKSISKPVIDRLPVNQLDEFACRQLDRLGKYGRRPVSRESRPGTGTASSSGRTRGRSSTTTSNVSTDEMGTGMTASSSSSYSESRSRTRDSGGYSDRFEHDGYDRPSSSETRGWTSALRGVRGRKKSLTEDSRRSQSPEGGWKKGKERRDVTIARDDGEVGLVAGVGQSQSRTPTPRQEQQQRETQVVQRSTWQAVLLEAGGIGAAVSEESMRRLKYCLQWLQYATEHIDTQILILRDFIASLQQHAEQHSSRTYHHHHSSSSNSGSSASATSSSPNSPPYSPTHTHHPFHNAHAYHPYNHPHAHHQEATDHLHTLTTIRRDVVDTIRQVVDVVSKYAGGALPEPARARVRSFILTLPQRWAAVATANVNLEPPSAAAPINPNATSSVGGQKVDGKGKVKSERASRGGRTSASVPYTFGEGSGRKSRPASRATSPSATRNGLGMTSGEPVGGVRNGVVPMAHTAQKILTLATESLDMLRAVTQVFKESLDKADAWVERLRVVGVQRPNSGQLDLPLPPMLSANQSPISPSSSSQSTVSSGFPSSTTTTATSFNSANSSSPMPLSSPTSNTRSSHLYDRPSHTISHQEQHYQGQVYEYREPLPPIILTPHPGSPVLSRAPSPSSLHTQLPPLQSLTAGSRPGSKLNSPYGGVGGNVQLPGVGAMFGEMSLVGCGQGQGIGLGLIGTKRREEHEVELEREVKRREIGGFDDKGGGEMDHDHGGRTEVNVVKMEVDG